MNKPQVLESKGFAKTRKKLDRSQTIALRKLVAKLLANPALGKPMRHDRRGTRELYMGSYRLSYEFCPDDNVIRLLELYHKNRQ